MHREGLKCNARLRAMQIRNEFRFFENENCFVLLRCQKMKNRSSDINKISQGILFIYIRIDRIFKKCTPLSSNG